MLQRGVELSDRNAIGTPFDCEDAAIRSQLPRIICANRTNRDLG